MHQIQVLGSGCPKCEKVAELIGAIAKEQGVEIELSKVSDPKVIMDFGVMRTPAVVVDQQLVHSGSIPTHEQVNQWLKAPLD